jgi:bifunctional non-homologous end joining protein LigD
MLATAGPLPTSDGFAFEPKWDGARAITRTAGTTQLFSRNANNLSTSFPELTQACSTALNGRAAVLDGEVIVLDRHNRPNFDLLRRRLHATRSAPALAARLPSTLVVFDVLHLDGHDLTTLPYHDRRAALEDLCFTSTGGRVVRTPAWTDIDGSDVFDVVRSMALEGVVAKALTSPYQAGRRSPWWVKTPVRRSGYFAVGGWTGRAGMLGSVLVGAYDVAGNFIYCGRIMSGFSDRARRELAIRLSEIGCVTAPFQRPPVDRDGVHWVTPLLVGRVEYREYTGQLRHAAWKGIAPVDPASAHLPIAL